MRGKGKRKNITFLHDKSLEIVTRVSRYLQEYGGYIIVHRSSGVILEKEGKPRILNSCHATGLLYMQSTSLSCLIITFKSVLEFYCASD